MMDYLNIDSENIKRISLLASDDGKIEKIYIELNDNKIEKITRPLDMEYDVFVKEINVFLKSHGITNANKNSKWFVTKKENEMGIDYDKLEEEYNNQQNKPKNELVKYSVLKVEKFNDYYENTDDEEAKLKAKLLINVISVGVFTLLLLYSKKAKGYLSKNTDLLLVLDSFAIICTLFNAALLKINKLIKKELMDVNSKINMLLRGD